MSDLVAWLLFFLKLTVVMLIIGIPLVTVIILVSKYLYEKFVGPLYEKHQKDKESK